jgi:hypothetical protein
MNIQKIIMALVLGISLIGCKKEETTILKPRQTVLDSIQRDFTETISNGSPGAYAVGYDFNVIKKGVINQLALCTPSIGVYQINIENTDTNDKDSVSINITAADTGKTIFKGITPMVANAGNYFRITFNDLDKPQYQYLRTGGMDQTYGDINLRWYVFQAQATASFINGPFGKSIDYTFGGVGFTFEKD